MKNMIKKICAVVIAASMVFTVPVPTSAVTMPCTHGYDKTLYTDYGYYTSTTHVVKGKECKVSIYKEYEIMKCDVCSKILFRNFTGRTHERHSINH